MCCKSKSDEWIDRVVRLLTGFFVGLLLAALLLATHHHEPTQYPPVRVVPVPAVRHSLPAR